MTAPLIAVAVCLIVGGVILYYTRKAGRDAVKAADQKETLDAIRAANAPLSDPELEEVRKKWRRD